MNRQNLRIGHGYDAHRFETLAPGGVARPLVLGGIRVPHTHGLLAHSDGDVLIHALCDALLGAIAAGDIGQHFSDQDESYRGVDSSRLLTRVMENVTARGFAVINADLTVLAQAPKLATHIPAMRQRLATLLAVPVDRVSVKATTTEGMGFVGREEGIASYAVLLLGPAQP